MNSNQHYNKFWIIKEECNERPEMLLKGKRAKPKQVFQNLEDKKIYYRCSECGDECCMIEVW